MNDRSSANEIVTRAPGFITMIEIGMQQRMATRYSELTQERAYLMGLMNLAVRTGDANLLATTRKRLAKAELECSDCVSALRMMRQFSQGVRVTQDGLIAA